jgi:hypothetical protein
LWAGDREAALAEVRRIAGIRPLNELPPTKHTVVGTVERKGYRIDKLIIDTEPGVRLPALLFKPATPTGRRVLHVHGSGKHVDAEAGGPIEKRVLAGEMVLAIDVRGVGELGSTDPGLWGGNWFDFFTAYLLGKSIVGMRAEDVLQASRFLSTWDNGKGPIDLVGIGGAGVPALHAAALEAPLYGRVRLERSLASWSDLVRHPDAPGQMINTVHGALRAYDLPDLVASLPRDKVTIEESLDLAKIVGVK